MIKEEGASKGNLFIAGCLGLLALAGVLAFIGFLVASVFYDPLKFAHGELHSEARLVIDLPEQKTLVQIHPLYFEAAQSGGFLHTYKNPGACTSEELRSKPDCVVVASSTWFESEYERTKIQRSVLFLFDYKFEGKFDVSKAVGSTLTFVLKKGSPESFTKEDWKLFFNYKDNILPKVFPGADISIHEARHPAVFTDDDFLRQIQQETDFEIPEKYLPAPEVP